MKRKILIALFALVVLTPTLAIGQSVFRVPQGGTGTSTVTSGAVIYGNGTGAFLSRGPCTDGQVVEYLSSVPICGTDDTSAGGGTYPFTSSSFGLTPASATTTLMLLSGGMVTGSSSIGLLTVGVVTGTSTTATSTFPLLAFTQGQGTGLSLSKLSVSASSTLQNVGITGALWSNSPATSTFASGIKIDSGCFQMPSGACLNRSTAVTFDVRDYGANFNDLVDDKAAIQLALNACGAVSGSIVVMPAGTGYLSGAITVPAECTLQGQGKQATKLQTTTVSGALPDGAMITTAASSDYITLEGFELLGHGEGETSGKGIYMPTGVHSFIVIRDVYVHGFPESGVHLVDPILCSLEDSWLRDNGLDGLFIDIGTTCNIKTVYASGNNRSGFHVKTHTSTAFTNTAAEYNTYGYWIESSGNITLNSPYVEITMRADGGTQGRAAAYRIQSSQNVIINAGYSNSFAYLSGVPAYHVYITGSDRVVLNGFRGKALSTAEAGFGEVPTFTLSADSTSDVHLNNTNFSDQLGTATSTNGISGTIRSNLTTDGYFGLGTSTPKWQLESASSTAPQLALTNALGNIFSFRVDSLGLNIGTSSPLTPFGTNTPSLLTVSSGGFGTTTLRGLAINGLATSTSNVGYNITTGCFAINSVCISGSPSSGTYPFGSPLYGLSNAFASSSVGMFDLASASSSIGVLRVGQLTATSTTASTSLQNVLFIQGQGTGLSVSSLSGGLATTTTFGVTSLTAANCDVKAGTTGGFYCGTDANDGAGGGSFPFTTGTWGLSIVNSTSTILKLDAGLVTSSSSIGLLSVGVVTGTSTTATSTLPLFNFTQAQGTGLSASNLSISGNGFISQASSTNLHSNFGNFSSSTIGNLLVGTLTATSTTASSSFAGTLGVLGNLQIGDAQGDSVTVNAGVVGYTNRSTTTIPASVPYAYTIATSTSVTPILAINTNSGTGIFGVGTSTLWRSIGFNGTIAMQGLTTATGGTNSTLCINSSNFEVVRESTTVCAVSTRREKHDINDLNLSGLDLVRKLNPVSFTPNKDMSGDFENRQYGFTAEAVAEVDPHFAQYGQDGLPRTLDDRAIMAALTLSIQELDKKVDEKGSTSTERIIIGMMGIVIAMLWYRVRRLERHYETH